MQQNYLLITLKVQIPVLINGRKDLCCLGDEDEEMKRQLQLTHCTPFSLKQNTHEYINSTGASWQRLICRRVESA